MKPDGVTTAALEPVETLEVNPANEEMPAPGQEPNQAASPGEGEAPQSQDDTEASKETPAKSNKKTPEDAKSKTPNKTAKTKPGSTPNKSAAASKTPASRLSNGVSKPQTNGVPKKTTPASDKKSTTATSASKKPTGSTPTPKSTPKPGEKKTPTANPLTNGAKTATAAAKKTPTAANGVKTTPTTAPAKKPAASKPAATKPSSTASPKPDKPPVSKTTRTPSSTSATRPPSTSTTKSSATASKPATPKPSTAPSKPATSKPTTPSAGKAPAAPTSKTPVKKDVSKSVTSTAKKPAESPYARSAPAPKPAKQEVPKSATVSKKPTASKTAESKTAPRPKPETKGASSKDASKSSKTTAPKATSPKKTVGSSTPTPVKRGPKATESEKDVAIAAAAVTAAAASVAAATVIAKPEEQPPLSEAGIQDLQPAPEQPKAEQMREPTPEPLREPTPEPIREPTPEPIREPTPEPVREPTPEPVREPTPEPVRELTPEPVREPTPEPDDVQALSHKGAELDVFEKTTDTSVTSLGTTVLSPPCSPTGPVSPAREGSHAPLLGFQPEENEYTKRENTNQEQDKEKGLNEKENLFLASTATFEAASTVMDEPHVLPVDTFASGGLMSPYEKQDAVEKAEEEINEDNDEEEDDEDEDHRRFGCQPSSMITDLSSSQPSEDIQRSSAFGGSMGWHGDDLLSGMDSEDMSSCTSSRQQGISDMSSTQHTAILEGTQSSDALVDSSLRGSEGDANLTGSPNVETIANEEEDEDDERVDDMDLSSEKVEEHHKIFSNQEQDDEDVEMHSEGKTESGENVEEDFNEDERVESLSQGGFSVNNPPTSTWGQTNPFGDTWSQSASTFPVSSLGQMSDHGAVDSETPTQSPAKPCFDSSVPTFPSQSEEEPIRHMSAAKDHDLLSAPADVPARIGGSESSTPEDLREYDSSSGVESRSDKQHTPVPAHGQPDVEQDLGIHMEKVDGEEEEAETLPADEVLGTGPPTAPASAPSSASTSGDEASDTEGEMQINDPDAPMTMGHSTGFDSPTPTSNLPTFDEDEEVMQAVSAEEDGGGATPQSANSVGSYGFDCTNSNSNAHSMAESCGKSPGIFSLENEEQLPVEAKDPSLIKELTLPSAGTAAEDLLDRPVNLMPLGHSEDLSGLDDHHRMMSSKMGAEPLHDVDTLEPGHLLDIQDSGDESQPPYYSTICDKTDSFLEGNV